MLLLVLLLDLRFSESMSDSSISMITFFEQLARVSTRIAFVANSKAAAVSDACSASDETHTNKNVLVLPFKLEHKIFVKLESRIGT